MAARHTVPKDVVDWAELPLPIWDAVSTALGSVPKPPQVKPPATSKTQAIFLGCGHKTDNLLQGWQAVPKAKAVFPSGPGGAPAPAVWPMVRRKVPRRVRWSSQAPTGWETAYCLHVQPAPACALL